MSNPTTNLAEIYEQFQTFTQSFQSFTLATVNEDGTPEASYAPFLAQKGHYYIYVSELAPHTKNLLQTQTCSVMWIEDEAETRQIFARKRATLLCQARDIARHSVEGAQILDALEAQFGKFMAMVRQLQDFHIIELTPQSGSYVAGFGKAYALTGEGLRTVRHRDEKA